LLALLLTMDDPSQTRILIADRQAALRSAIRLFLEKQPHLHVVGEAADVQELLSQIETTQPDIILLDWGLGDRSRADPIRVLHQLDGRSGVIVLDVQPESAPAALAAGANAFVSKGNPPHDLLAAIHALESERRNAQWSDSSVTWGEER
jgi:DNA-binding NarL/FixJ family response regulator